MDEVELVELEVVCGKKTLEVWIHVVFCLFGSCFFSVSTFLPLNGFLL